MHNVVIFTVLYLFGNLTLESFSDIRQVSLNNGLYDSEVKLVV